MYTLNLRKMKALKRRDRLKVGRFDDLQPTIARLTQAERTAWARNQFKTNDGLWRELQRRATARATGRIDTLRGMRRAFGA